MARLEKLQILGFRSFSPDENHPGPQIIAFYNRETGQTSPLTLILGQNGCGKTTIIECLKYATTGECPPGTTKGQTFVHDPHMTKGKRESAGTVKLLYKSANGDQYQVNRTLQAFVKYGKVSIKTLDGTLKRTRASDGKVTHLNQKCADLNSLVLTSLGVEKSILNYVIFCHQEDSNWPLEEGSKVKAKFDEIFSSAKYNAALKEFKTVRKNYLDEIKLDKKDLDFIEENQRDAAKKKSQLKIKEENKKELEVDLKTIVEELGPVEKELIDMRELESNFSGVQEKRKEAETKLGHYRTEVRDLRSNIKEEIPPETTSNEQIRRMKRELDKDRQEIEGDIEDKRQHLIRLNKTLTRHKESIGGIDKQIGSCQNSKEKNEAAKQKLSSNLRKMAVKHGMGTPSSSSMPLGEMEELMDNMAGLLKVKRDELSESEEKFQREIDAKVKGINDLIAAKAEKDEQLKSKRLEKAESKREISRLKRILDELEGAENQLRKVKGELKSKEDELIKVQSKVDLDSLRETISVNNSSLEKLEAEGVSLQKLKEKFEVVRDKTLVIKSKKEDCRVRQAALDKLLSKKNTELVSVFGSASDVPPPKDIKRLFNVKNRELTKTKRDLEDKLRSLKNDQATSKEKRLTLLKEKQSHEQRVSAFNRSMEQVCGDGDFEGELERAKNEVEKTRNELQSKEANKFTYREQIDRLTAMKENSAVKPSCPTCNRHFDEKSQVDELIEELSQEVEKIPSKVQSIKKKLDRSQAKVDKLQELLPEKKQTDELKVKLAEMETTLADLDRNMKQLSEKLSDCEDELDAVSMDYSACEDLVRDEVVTKISQYNDEVVALEAHIRDLEKKLPTVSSEDGDYQDYESVQAAEKSITEKTRALRRKVQADRNTETDHARKLNDIQRERNALESKKLQIEKNQQERAANEEKKAGLEAKVTETDFIIAQISTSLAPIAENLSSEQDAKSELEQRKSTTGKQLQRDIEGLNSTNTQHQADLDALKDYVDSNNEEKLVELNSDRKRATAQMEKTDNEIKTVGDAKVEQEKKLSNHDNMKRNYDDNIKLREYVKQEAEMESLVEKYEKQLADLDWDNVKKKKKALGLRYQSLESQKNKLEGQQEELAKTIEDIRVELEDEKLRDAKENYRKKDVEIELKKIVCEDLNKYYAALEWAITRFHKERMEQINKIIRELWRATYQGTDIDYIEIKTDEIKTEGDKFGIEAARKKVNYSVVMNKGGAEMEMRGRCSAGQKVLASLIIRLALAETFSVNCGMIALDEPTTNLDQENIEAFARALTELVQRRSVQHNFQLIVITHDNDLIEQLARSEEVEKYFRVCRNENGQSVIKPIGITSYR